MATILFECPLLPVIAAQMKGQGYLHWLAIPLKQENKSKSA